MRTGVSCSWCHEMNWSNQDYWPICKNCGHRADVARVDCDCISCVRAHGLPRERASKRVQ